MRLVDRYLLRELLVPLGYCLGGFVIFWISFDLLSDLDKFQERQLSARDVASLYLASLPELLILLSPMALLLALLYSLTNHARHNELTALRSAGLSLWRLGLPYFVVGLFMSLSLFYMNEYLAPPGKEKAERILNRQSGHPHSGRSFNFVNDREQRIWNIKAYYPESALMLEPRVESRASDGSRRLLIAESGSWTGTGWCFSNVIQLIQMPSQELPPLQTNLLCHDDWIETPELIRSEMRVSQLSSMKAAKRPQLSLAEIDNYFRLHPHLSPAQKALLLTQWHGRLAEPWTCLVVVLIAMPFGATLGRRNVLVGVANSIFISFVYFVLMKLGLALGTGGYVMPWLAAWAPNLFFACLGIWLLWRMP